MTELKETITYLFFGSTFTAGFAMGIFSAIGIYYSSKRKKEIDQEEDKAIAETNDIKKGYYTIEYSNLYDIALKKGKPYIRTLCIDLSKYTHNQRVNIYNMLVELNEPIFRGYDNSIDWISDDYNPTMVLSTMVQFLGFSKQNGWIELSSGEVESKGLIKTEYNEFINLIKIQDEK